MFSGDLWRSQLIKKKKMLKKALPEVGDLTHVHAAAHFSGFLDVFVDTG